jgi:hypothetical protein
MGIEDLARRVLDETHAKWRSLEGRYPAWRSGFAVFYSPVREDSQLVILGLNPGGTERDFTEVVARQLPTEHDYFPRDPTSDYPLARRMRQLFDEIGRPELLRDSVKLNLIFFRTKDSGEWHGLDPTLRRDLETFCAERVRAVLHALRPKIVLTEGIDTFERLLLSDLPLLSVRRHRIYSRLALPPGAKVIGITHPTGTRVGGADWERIGEQLRRDLEGD